MCVRAKIPARPHEIEVSEGVSIFIEERKIKRLMAIDEKMSHTIKILFFFKYSGRYISRNVTLINFWTFVTVLRDLFS